MTWGDPFLNSERQGLTGALEIKHTGWINDPANLRRLKQLGYRKIVMLNPSPLAVATTTATGQQEVKIVDLHQYIPTVAKNWPVVHDSVQLLIMQIPEATN